mgnify:FL=1
MVLRVLIGVVLLLGLLLGVQTYRLDKAQDYHQEYVAAIQEKLVEAYRQRNTERNRSEHANALADVRYEQGKRDAEELQKRVVASLTADNDSVRLHWQQALRRANAAEAAAANSGGDGSTGSVSTDLADIVRRAAEGDARIVRLQQRIDIYLQQVNGEGWYESLEQ